MKGTATKIKGVVCFGPPYIVVMIGAVPRLGAFPATLARVIGNVMMGATALEFRDAFVRAPGALKHLPALVLNADYRPLSYYPLSLWPWQEAIKAVFLDRVNIVAEYDQVVRSQHASFRVPSVVVLKDYVKPQKKVAFTRFNLFLRDEFRCQYCGSPHDLTFDHVIPRVRGGVTSWENVVAACSPCNLRKGSRSLRASGLRLARPPRRPTAEEMRNNGRRFPPNHLHESWLDYLYWDSELEA